MKTLFRNARILTMADDKVINGDLVVEDKRIVYIGKDSKTYGPFDRVVECDNKVLMPGFKNAHAHSAMVFLRDVPEDVTLQEWLFDYVLPREERLIPGDVYNLNKVAYLEYLEGGITFCFEHYYYPRESAQAAKEMGMRTLLLETCSLGGTSTSEDELKEDFKFNQEKDGLVRMLVGFHAEYTLSEELLKGVKEAISVFKTPFYTHIAETQKEVDECYERHQKTPLKYLFDEGLFKYGGGGFHCVHYTDEDIKICKDNGINIVSCPGSNKKLKSGSAPLAKFLENGVNVALGTDGPASNYALDMFLEMQLAAEQNKTIPPYEILKMATVNASKAMGLDNADVLAKGKYADIIMLDVKDNDVIPYIVNKGSKKDVKLTMINGQILYENGQYNLNESVEEINQRAEEISRRLANK